MRDSLNINTPKNQLPEINQDTYKYESLVIAFKKNKHTELFCGAVQHFSWTDCFVKHDL